MIFTNNEIFSEGNASFCSITRNVSCPENSMVDKFSTVCSSLVIFGFAEPDS